MSSRDQYSLNDGSDGTSARRADSLASEGLWNHLWAWRKYVILLAAPFLLAPLPAVLGSSESRCAYVVLLMAVYWFTEAMPVGVTALLPVVLFPTLGILDTNSTTMLYMKDTNMLFVGGLLVAIAIEYWNLHRRIALRILMFVGSEPRWLMLGLMLATWFLSMWISNTATTAMMIPITEAILQQLEGTRRSQSFKQTWEDGSDGKDVAKKYKNSSKSASEIAIELSVAPYPKEKAEKEASVNGATADFTSGVKNGASGDASPTGQTKDVAVAAKMSNGGAGPSRDADDGNSREDAEFNRLCKGMSLCICYAASCGGIASLTGTGPNLILKENSDALYEKSSLSNPVTFGSWMAFGLPMSVLVLVIAWVWLQIAFLGRRGVLCCLKGETQDLETSSQIKDLIKNEYKKLGPIVFGQGMVLLLFVFLVILWVTRDMGGEVGWGKLFDLEVKDSVPAILVGILLFVLPSTVPCISSYSDYWHPQKLEQATPENKIIIRPLLTWQVANKKMPWQLIFLLGGGFALSGGFDKSGLSDWIGDQLEFFKDWNEWAVLIMICYIAAACTEVTSNTAMSSVLLPIMQRLAAKIGSHPLSYMFPVCLSTSFAFMLPVATPPNAIVFTYGRVKISDMAKAGIVMNILAVPCVVLMTKTLGKAVFDFSENPADFSLNSTLLVPNVM